MVPATGLRFTCTSSGDMKMLTRVAGWCRNCSSRSSRTSSTRPSAGETTRWSSGGGRRSGSRKKYRQKPTPSRRGSTAAGCPAATPTIATTPRTPAAMAITGQPSRAIGIRRVVGLLGASVARAVDEAVRGEPRHERPQLRSDVLDRVLRGLAAQLAEVRLAAAVLGHPLVGELAGLDVVEDLLHRLARLLADDPLAARHVAVLGGVADGVAHVGDAALVDQVDDELHLVPALEVGHRGRVAPLHQGLVAGADQLGEAAAQDRLLAEEIRLGLLLEGRLERGGARAADALRPGERELERVAGRVLLDGDQTGDAAALLVLAAHQVTWPLRGHHEHVDVGRRHHLLEVDVEAVAEGQVLAGGQPGRDLLLVDLGALLVGHQHHDDVGLLGGGGRVDHPQALGLRLAARRAVRAEPDAHVAAAVAQVEGMGVSLAAVADDLDALAAQRLQGRVLVVEDLHDAARSFSFASTVRSRVPRNIATLPVRTISLMPIGFNSSISASILSSVPVTSITYERRDTSMIFPRKTSTMLTTSPRERSSTATFSRTSWRSTCAVSVKSMTRITLMSLFSCFSICSST